MTAAFFFRRPAAFAAFALALGAAACVRDPDPFVVDTDDVAVHLILEAGSDSVAAIVETPAAPLPDARVRLIAGADTTDLVYDVAPCAPEPFGGAPASGCHRALLAEPIRAGATYRLEIELGDGHLITGSTTVPLPLTVTTPSVGQPVDVECRHPDTCYAEGLDQPPFYVPVLELVVHWAEPADAERLFGFIRPLRTFLDAQEFGPAEGCVLGYHGFGSPAFGQSQSADLATDSAVIEIPNIVCPPPLGVARFDSIHAEARVVTWNAEYEEYLEMAEEFGRSTRAEFVSVGLEGAWGVFGATTTTAIPITLVRDPPPTP